MPRIQAWTPILAVRLGRQVLFQLLGLGLLGIGVPCQVSLARNRSVPLVCLNWFRSMYQNRHFFKQVTLGS